MMQNGRNRPLRGRQTAPCSLLLVAGVALIGAGITVLFLCVPEWALSVLLGLLLVALGAAAVYLSRERR